MYYDGKIWIGKSGDENIYVYPRMSNRHGLIAGATGTGKTITLKVMAESFSDAGVPVFLADAKGDLSGMCSEGTISEDMQKRIDFFGLDGAGFNFKSYPVNYWDVYGENGIPLRTTISEMGPLLLARIMGLNDTQTDILNVIFKIADDNSLLLIDTKDLKSMLTYVSENSKELSGIYGNLPTVSLNAILRAVIALEADGGEQFFAEPALNIKDWLTVDSSGRGFIQVLDAQKLMLNPKMYSMFLLWMISELYETLPEAGDLDKPKMVFFFDEAHMLFDSAPKILLEKIEQVVKLIRSKGVGIYFITQNPRDIPDGVLSQLGNKVQHALHAYTPNEQKAMRAAVAGFRENPEFDTYTVLSELGTGEALVSALDEEGVPTIVKKVKILPPQSKMGIIDDSVRRGKIESAMLYGKYNYYVDNESAYERLTAIKQEQDAVKAEEDRIKEEEKANAALAKQQEKERLAAEKQAEKERIAAEKQAAKEKAAEEKAAEKAANAKKNSVKRAAKSVASSTAGTIGREVGNSLGKSVGGTFGKRIGGNVGASLARGIIGTLFK